MRVIYHFQILNFFLHITNVEFVYPSMASPWPSGSRCEHMNLRYIKIFWFLGKQGKYFSNTIPFLQVLNYPLRKRHDPSFQHTWSLIAEELFLAYLASWILERNWNCATFTQNRRMTNFDQEKLTWAFSSYKLKRKAIQLWYTYSQKLYLQWQVA